MADPAQFFQGSGDLASKRLPPVAAPTYSPFERDVGSGASALGNWLSGAYRAVAAPAADYGRVAGAYFGGTPQTLQQALGAVAGPQAAPAAPSPSTLRQPASLPITGVGASYGPRDNFPGPALPPMPRYAPPTPQSTAATAATALAAANGAPQAHSISVEYGGNPTPRVFNFNADGSPAQAAAMPKLDFSQMTPGQVANAYMQPGIPHKAMRDAYAMSGLNNPHAQMAGRYYDLVTKLSAAGIDPLNLPKGSLVASELAALREGMSAGYYQTDRTLGTGMPQ